MYKIIKITLWICIIPFIIITSPIWVCIFAAAGIIGAREGYKRDVILTKKRSKK